MFEYLNFEHNIQISEVSYLCESEDIQLGNLSEYIHIYDCYLKIVLSSLKKSLVLEPAELIY